MRISKWLLCLAVALVFKYDDIAWVGLNYVLRTQIIYVGSDVPGTYWRVTQDLAIPTTVTSATIQASIATAVRSDATSRGLTVGAGNVWMPAWVTQ